MSSATSAPGLVLSRDATVGEGVRLGANVVIHAGVRVGDGCVIQDGAVLGKRPELGPRTQAGAHAPAGPLVLERDAVVCAGAVLVEGARVGEAAIVGDHAFVREGATIGAGSVLGHGCAIGHHAAVGRYVRIFNNSVIGPYTEIEDEVDLAPHVVTTSRSWSQEESDADRVILRRACRVGANAVLLAGVEVGERAVVGACAMVDTDVPSGMLAVGVPARVVGPSGGGG